MTLPTLCEHCFNKAHRDDIKCTESCYSLDAYNQEIAKAIAARDKEWIAIIEHAMKGNCCDRLHFHLTPDKWQQLKREVKNER
jgi:hypothetical protein